MQAATLLLTHMLPLMALIVPGVEGEVTGWIIPSTTTSDGQGLLTVSEDQEVASTIAMLEATSDSAVVTYTLLSVVPPFNISCKDELTITAPLDYETVAAYTIYIRAVDEEACSSTATIKIIVSDVNEAPSFNFTSRWTVILDESSSGKVLTTVTASDQDVNDTVTYSIAFGNSNNDFNIESSTGEITVRRGITLDASTTAGYVLVVEAVDEASTVTVSPTANTNTKAITEKDGNCDGINAFITISVSAFAANMITLTFLVLVYRIRLRT